MTATVTVTEAVTEAVAVSPPLLLSLLLTLPQRKARGQSSIDSGSKYSRGCLHAGHVFGGSVPSWM